MNSLITVPNLFRPSIVYTHSAWPIILLGRRNSLRFKLTLKFFFRLFFLWNFFICPKRPTARKNIKKRENIWITTHNENEDKRWRKIKQTGDMECIISFYLFKVHQSFIFWTMVFKDNREVGRVRIETGGKVHKRHTATNKCKREINS